VIIIIASPLTSLSDKGKMTLEKNRKKVEKMLVLEDGGGGIRL